MITIEELEILKNNTIQLQELSKNVSMLAKQTLDNYQQALQIYTLQKNPEKLKNHQGKLNKVKKKSLRKKRKI